MLKMRFDIQMFGGRGASSGTSNNAIASLKNGAIITVGGKKNYTPTSFKYEDGEVYYKNRQISGSIWAKHPQDLEGISKHFDRMKKEGFTLKEEGSKGKYTIAYHKARGTEVLNSVPKGYVKLEGATTAPNGYSWYSNGKSRFGGEYKSVLVKDKKRRK